jgi:hypothetical protein
VLIRAHEDYYGIDQVPQFWDWLLNAATNHLVKMPFEIHDEIAVSTGILKDWITTAEVKQALILDEEVNQDLVYQVLTQGYASDLSDSEIEKLGRDPFLIAYAMAQADRVVVTKEVSKPSKVRAIWVKVTVEQSRAGLGMPATILAAWVEEPAGLLDDNASLEIAAHLFIGSKASWM